MSPGDSSRDPFPIPLTKFDHGNDSGRCDCDPFQHLYMLKDSLSPVLHTLLSDLYNTTARYLLLFQSSRRHGRSEHKSACPRGEDRGWEQLVPPMTHCSLHLGLEPGVLQEQRLRAEGVGGGPSTALPGNCQPQDTSYSYTFPFWLRIIILEQVNCLLTNSSRPECGQHRPKRGIHRLCPIPPSLSLVKNH